MYLYCKSTNTANCARRVNVPYVIGSHEGVLIFHALRFPLIVLEPPLPSRDWKGGPVTLSGIDYLSGPRPFRLFLPTVNANLVFVIRHSDAEFSFASGRQPYIERIGPYLISLLTSYVNKITNFNTIQSRQTLGSRRSQEGCRRATFGRRRSAETLASSFSCGKI